MPSNLLTNASATGEGIAVGGGAYVISADGTFGGTTLQLQLLSPDGASWLAIANATFTAEGSLVVDLPDGVIRMAVTGGTPSALYAHAGLVG